MDASSDDSDFRDTPARTSRITSARHNRAEILLACIKCSYKTTVKSNLKRHEKTHDDARGFVAQKIYCPELGCNQGVATVAKLREHLSTSHSRTIETEQLLFQNSEEFQSWMTDLQEKSLVKFVKMKSRSGRAAYQCNRSGAYKPQGTGKRMQKKNGTIKCGRTCPCGLELQMDTSGIKVTYFKTHIGHIIEPGRIGLSSPQKRKLAASLSEGVPKTRILQNIQKTFTGEITPLYLATNQDLQNIASKYRIASDVVLDSNDAESVHQKILQLRSAGDHSVFLYKPCGTTSAEYLALKKEEFVLAYMNTGQECFLKTHGTRIISIDSTHGTNGYNFELTTFVTFDDQFEGFPVAFFFHSSKSEDTYKIFFSALRERIGTICTSIFMSDDEPAFYNAWRSIMGSAGKKLLCSWHVARNWKKKLAGLDATLKTDTFVKLQAVHKETYVLTFETAFPQLLVYMENHTKLQSYVDYFQRYWTRKEDWAYCYRLHAGINTNMSIEHMHKDVKYEYLLGKRVKRLDAGFNAVLNFLQSRQQNRLKSIHRGKISTKDRLLRKAHRRSLNKEATDVIQLTDCWMVPSFSTPLLSYKVIRAVDDCACTTTCPVCLICIHNYICDCIESSIRSNMCKHVHLLAQYLKKDPTNESAEDQDVPLSDDSDDEDELIIDTTDFLELRQEEVRAHTVDLSRNVPEDIKEDLRRQFEELLAKSEDTGTLKIIGDCLKTASLKIQMQGEFRPTFQATARREPGNKNIEKQKRFQKPRPRKQVSATVTSSDVEVMSQIIPPVFHQDSQ